MAAPMRIEDIKPGLALVGVEPTVIVSIVAVVPITPGTAQVVYRPPGGVAFCRRVLRRGWLSRVRD